MKRFVFALFLSLSIGNVLGQYQGVDCRDGHYQGSTYICDEYYYYDAHDVDKLLAVKAANPQVNLNWDGNNYGNWTGCTWALGNDNLKHLTKFSCNYNLTSLDLSGCKNLTDLNSSGLTSLNVSGCVSLTYFNCTYNPLDSLDVSGCISLKSLNCSKYLIYDGLTSLIVSGCTSLTDLDCRSNQLTSLDVSGLTSLTSLKCGNNQLASLDVSGCTSLTDLQCGSNPLPSLDLKDCNNLTSLQFDYNYQLISLDVSGLTNLTRLVCRYNYQLDSLNVNGCTNLAYLDCGENQLLSLDVSSCTSLTYLNCWSNGLTSLNVKGCAALTELNCSYNELISLDVSGCTNLKILECHNPLYDNNRLTLLDVSGCTGLTELVCSYNWLSVLDVSSCTNLTELRCNDNLLSSLNVSDCTNLTELWCSNNQLTTLDVSGLTSLTEFSCAFNRLTSLDVSSCTSLTDLTCQNNQIISLDVSRCANLTGLDCNDNKLTSLNVSGCTNLTSLSCYNNQLTDENLPVLYGLPLEPYDGSSYGYSHGDKYYPPGYYFDLLGNKGFTESAIHTLADSLPNITYEQILYDSIPGPKEYKLTNYLTLYYEKCDTIAPNHYNFSGNLNINKILHFDCSLDVKQNNSNTATIQGDGIMYANNIQGNLYPINTSRTSVVGSYGGLIYYTASGEFLNLVLTFGDNYVYGADQLAGVATNIGNIEFDKSAQRDWIKMDYSIISKPPFPIKNIIDYYIKVVNENSAGLSDEDKKYNSYMPPQFKGSIYYSHSEGNRYALDVQLNNKIDLGFARIDQFALNFDPVKDIYSGKIKISISLSKKNIPNILRSFSDVPVEIVSDSGKVLQNTTLENYLLERKALLEDDTKMLTLELNVEYKDDIFKMIIAASGLKIPIPDTPFQITKIAVSEEFNTQVFYLALGATVDIGPIATSSLNTWLGSIIEGKDIGFKVGAPPVSVTLSGKITVFKTDVANAKINYTWSGLDKNSAVMSALIGFGQWTWEGDMNVLDILTGKLSAGINSERLYGQIYGSIQAPKWLTKYDLFSSISGQKFKSISANAYANWVNPAFMIDFELEHPIPFVDKISCAAICTSDSGFIFTWGKNLKELGINTSSLKSSNANIYFYLADENTPTIYLTMWGENAPVNFSAISPSGKTYTKQNNSQYTTIEENTQTIMAIDKPDAGEWTVIPDATYDQFKVYSMNMAPTVMFDKPVTTETSTDIRLLLNDFNDDLTVTLFYDDDKSGFNGVPITEITGFHDAILDYHWDTQDLPAGDYYIYCRVDDGNNTPILLYAPGVIKVNSGTAFNTVPQNLKCDTKNNTVVVSWDASNDKQISYATVYYKDDKTGTILGQTCDGDSTSVILDRLIPGMRYQVWATYADTLGVESNISNIVEFTYLISGNNPPYITSNEDYWVFREDQSNKMDFNTFDADGNKLTLSVLEKISNYRLTENSFKWTPTANDLSLDMLHIVVSDVIAKDTLQQKIRFISKENQDISASFAASTLYDANYHFVKIKNPLLTRSKFENVLIQNKRTGYTIILPCDKVSDDLFMGKLVLTRDEYSFIPVQQGDTIELNYQYGGNTYTDYAIYSPVETRAFRLTTSYVASLNGAQYAYVEPDKNLTDDLNNPAMSIYPNPNNGEFYIHCETLKNMGSYHISIYDLQGKLIYNMQDISQGDILHRKINISNVTKGNYLIKLVVVDKTGKNIYTNSQKIMVR